ncbi:hypothetical protein V5E97_12695 [Singulisphaera sp. Ch08]|uniref:Uncharacterized protein n=1 Tax=Singulisphaera sp. Ch08 TaxID=3120278 RepID=A0AAU7CPB8_9BACT
MVRLPGDQAAQDWLFQSLTEQKLKNVHGVVGGHEIRSSYLIDDERIWINTVPGRGHTTICISEDL